MFSSISTIQSMVNKCNKLSGPSTGIHITITGTNGIDYILSTYAGYTFYAIANNQTLNISSIIGSGAQMYWLVVGGGGGGGNGNSTLSGSCNGANGGGMVYGIFNATSTTSLSISIGSGGIGSVSTVNGYTNNYPTIGNNTIVNGSGLSITAYGGNSGTYNTVSGAGLAQKTNASGSSGVYTGLTSASTITGGIGGLSQGTTGNLPTAGSTGNICNLIPFQSGPYNLPFGSGGTGGANTTQTPMSAPFCGGGGNGTLTMVGVVNSTYNLAVLSGVSGNTNSSNATFNTKSYAGSSASNSGAGGSSSQAQGNASNGGSGIVIVAILTSNLY